MPRLWCEVCLGRRATRPFILAGPSSYEPTKTGPTLPEDLLYVLASLFSSNEVLFVALWCPLGQMQNSPAEHGPGLPQHRCARGPPRYGGWGAWNEELLIQSYMFMGGYDNNPYYEWTMNGQIPKPVGI